MEIGRITSFSLILPVHNCRDVIEEVLRAAIAAAHRWGDAEIIVVDHESTDGTSEFLLQQQRDSVRVYPFRGKTVAAVRNFGASLARGEFLCFIDGDCLIEEDFLVRANQILTKVKVGALTCAYVPPKSAHWIEQVWHVLHFQNQAGAAKSFYGGNLIIRTDVFHALGGFNPNLVSGEDTELAARLIATGHRIFFDPELCVVHLRNPKSVRQFFRRQLWHGLGMLGRSKGAQFSWTLMLSLGQLMMLVSALLLPFIPVGSLANRLILAPLFTLPIPAVAVAYRFWSVRRVRWPLRSFFLYYIYYLARALAIVKYFLRSGK
jgi:glycosyltransferase involved in cell wall biosynthesis